MTYLAIFDVDGTLVDSQAAIYAAAQAAHATLGLECPERPRVLELVGLTLETIMARLHPEAPAAMHDALCAAYRESFAAHRLAGEPDHASPLYPGVAEGLARLGDAGILLGTATGKSRRGLTAVLEKHALQRHFVTLQCADGHPSKPHPAMVLAAIAEAGAGTGRALMIGDTEYDIEMGRAAGARTVGVAWGYHAPARLTAAGADHLVTGFPELVDLILELAA